MFRSFAEAVMEGLERDAHTESGDVLEKLRMPHTRPMRTGEAQQETVRASEAQ
jgi:hypothetical protein